LASAGKRVIGASGILKNAFQDYYIMPKPNEFLYACHPDDTKWQLIKNPITRQEFLQKAYLLPPFSYKSIGILLFVVTAVCTFLHRILFYKFLL
jgi:hypothetical protein